MFSINLIQRMVIALAVFTTLGVLVHDTKFDKAVTMALPVMAISFGMSAHALDFSDSAHTHVEKVSVKNAFSSLPRVQPRNDYRKYNLARYMSNANDDFNGSRILWPSV